MGNVFGFFESDEVVEEQQEPNPLPQEISPVPHPELDSLLVETLEQLKSNNSKDSHKITWVCCRICPPKEPMPLRNI